MRLITKNNSIGRYLAKMQSQTKAAGVKLPEVHSARKTIVTHSPIEKQNPRYKRNR